MSPYKVKIKDKAILDIEDITDWYNQRAPNLGLRFKKNLKSQINSLKNNSHSYNIRYNNMRVMVVKKFPFLIHYLVDDVNQIVEIFAIIHTSRSPGIWPQNNENI